MNLFQKALFYGIGAVMLIGLFGACKVFLFPSEEVKPNLITIQSTSTIPEVKEKSISPTSTVKKPVVKITPKVVLPDPIIVTDTKITHDNVLNLVNNQRIAAGLEPLEDSPDLDVAANLKLNDEISKHYFAHKTPDGQLPWIFLQQIQYPYKYAGENLAKTVDWTVQTLVGVGEGDKINGWMNSAPHKTNILNPQFTKTGIAIGRGVVDNEDVLLIVQFFSQPL